MNSTNCVDNLISRLQRELLGHIIISLFGYDIEVARIASPLRRDLVIGEKNYHYKHRTVASLNNVVIGRARTYWSGPEEEWEWLRSQRMLHILNEAELSFSSIRLDKQRRILSRNILASLPSQCSSISIFEKIFLRELNQIIVSEAQNYHGKHPSS